MNYDSDLLLLQQKVAKKKHLTAKLQEADDQIDKKIELEKAKIENIVIESP